MKNLKILLINTFIKLKKEKINIPKYNIIIFD